MLDQLMPDYHFHEVHGTRVDAPPEAVARALRSLRPGDVRSLAVLLSLRNLPSRLLGQRAPSWSSERPLLDQVLERGFVLLAEEPDRELVLGVIGRFWHVGAWTSEGGLPHVAGAPEFAEFDDPGYAKAAANFRVDGSGSVTRLTTETRIRATDPSARRKFAAYWMLIRPGSGLIRRDLLRAVRRRAEQPEPSRR